MAEASINIGQQALTFILIFLLTLILSGFASLLQAVTTQLFNILDWSYLQLLAWHYPIKHRKKKVPLQPQYIATLWMQEQARAPPYRRANQRATVHTALSYLVPLGLIAFKVGCCIEYTLVAYSCFQEFIFWTKKPFLPGFLRIYFFSCVFQRNFSQERGFGGGRRNS